MSSNDHLTKIRSIIIQKQTIEQWISAMAFDGWTLKSFQPIIFNLFILYNFEKEYATYQKVCMYDLKWKDDEEIFVSYGWRELCRYGRTLIYVSDDIYCELPLLDMRLYMRRRALKSICNICFLISLLYSVRIVDDMMRGINVFMSSFVLLTYPLLFDISSRKKGTNFTRILFNIALALMISFVITLLLDVLVKSFYLVF